MMGPAFSKGEPSAFFNDARATGGWREKVQSQLEYGYGVEIIRLGDANIPGGKNTFVTWVRDDVREVCDVRTESKMNSEGKQMVSAFCDDVLVEPSE